MSTVRCEPASRTFRAAANEAAVTCVSFRMTTAPTALLEAGSLGVNVHRTTGPDPPAIGALTVNPTIFVTASGESVEQSFAAARSVPADAEPAVEAPVVPGLPEAPGAADVPLAEAPTLIDVDTLAPDGPLDGAPVPEEPDDVHAGRTASAATAGRRRNRVMIEP
jgi:hypothetical protein